MTTEEIIKLALETTGQQGLADLATKALEAKKALEATKDAANELEKKELDLQSVASSGKGLFEALLGGDVSGIVDGLTSLSAMVPGISAFSPAIKGVGEAAKVAWPILKDWYGQLTDVSAKVGEATKTLSDYTKALQDNVIALKESDAVATLRKADEAAAATPTSRAKQRAETLQALIGGRGEKTLEEITQAIHEDRADEKKEQAEKAEAEYQAVVKSTTSPERQLRENADALEIERRRAAKARDKALSEIGAGEQGKAEDLLKKAQAGDADALLQLERLFPEGSAMSETFRLAGRQEQTEAQRGREYAEQQRRASEDRRKLRDKIIKDAQEQIRTQIMPKIGKALGPIRARARKQRDVVEKARKELEGWRQATDEAKATAARSAKIMALPRKIQDFGLNRRQNLQGAQATQMEAAEQGVNINLGRALQIFQQRIIERDQLQRTLGAGIHQANGTLQEQILQLRMQVQQQRVQASARSAQSNGFPN